VGKTHVEFYLVTSDGKHKK